MTYRNLLKFSFTQNFCDEKWVVFSLTYVRTLKYDRVIKAREIFNFFPLINNAVAIEFSFLF